MDPKFFRHSPTGKLIKTSRGYFAFTPHPLPPQLGYTSSLVALLSEADRAMGRLAGVGERLPNPDLLVMPYMRREAVLSSKIEGTQASLSDLLFYEAGEAQEAKRSDILEIQNYMSAMGHGLARLKDLPVCLRLITELHERLMEGVRGGESAPGEFRKTQNWIGTPGCPLTEASYVPPPVEELTGALRAWELYVHQKDSTPPLVKCALLHYQFEAIHPFLDGNGRIGRLLIPLFLCAAGYLPQPLLYLSAYFERHREEYYRRLLAVSQEGAWIEWIAFFLRGVARQATDALDRSRRILELRGKYRELLQRQKRVTAVVLGLLDHLFKYPIITVNHAALALKVSYPTAKTAVARLEAVDILKPYSPNQRWGRLYWAKELFDVISGAEQEDSAKPS